MFSKLRYMFVDNLSILKTMKPIRRITQAMPDFSYLNTSGVNDNFLKILQELMASMLFMPKYEQLTYAGKVFGTPPRTPEDEGKSVQVDGQWYTKEFYDAYTQYRNNFIDTAPESWTNPGGFGVFHRMGDVKPGGSSYGFWGGGEGAAYSNLKFDATLDDIGMGFIRDKSDNNKATSKALALNGFDGIKAALDRLHQSNYASQLGLTFEQVLNTVQTRFKGKSFYEIVIEGDWKNDKWGGTTVTDPEAFCLMLLMLEMRERFTSTMAEVFGDLKDTENDTAMIGHLRNWIKEMKANGMSSHAFAILPLFLEMQHSIINELTAYSCGRSTIGSDLDNTQFAAFKDFIGRKTQAYIDSIDEKKDPNKKTAASKLRALWFAPNDLGGKVFGDIDFSGDGKIDDSEKERSKNKYYFPIALYTIGGGYGWDRKWQDESNRADAEKHTRISPYASGHFVQTQQQIVKLSPMDIRYGSEHSVNWATYFIGTLWREGIDKDLELRQIVKDDKRQANIEFKESKVAYDDREMELKEEEQKEEAARMKAEAQNAAYIKKLQKKDEERKKLINGNGKAQSKRAYNNKIDKLNAADAAALKRKDKAYFDKVKQKFNLWAFQRAWGRTQQGKKGR